MNSKIKKVLIIEDDEPTIFLTKLILSSINCVDEINTCNDGLEAMQYLIKEDDFPELILLDINMPGMDGWEFIETLKNTPLQNKEKINIYMLSTSTFENDKQKACKDEMIKGFINKPLTINSLENILEQIA